MLKSLALRWVLGFNKDIPGLVHNISDEKRSALLFVAGNAGVIHDLESSKQILLQGHTHSIIAACVSADRSLAATADNGGGGKEAMVALWEARSGKCVGRCVGPHEKGEIAIWKWSANVTTPIATAAVPLDETVCAIRFNSLNADEFVTTGPRGVVFWVLDRNSKLVSFVPSLAGSRFFKKGGATMGQTMYLAKTTMAVTSTNEGEVILWDVNPASSSNNPAEKRAMKSVKLHDTAILFIASSADKYLVTGGEDGFIRFYDFQFRLLAWMENINSGPIISLSFANTALDPYSTEEFQSPKLIAASRLGVIMEIDPERWDERPSEGTQKQGKEVLLMPDGNVSALCASPKSLSFAIGSHSGLVQVWDMEDRHLFNSVRFDKLQVSAIAYNPEATFLAIGFTNGMVKVVRATVLMETPANSFHHCKGSITHIAFCGTHIAVADTDRCVALYHFRDDECAYISKYRSHGAPITGLVFGKNEDMRLLSLGEDRRLVEYDVAQSASVRGLVVKSVTQIEQTAVPTALIWHPHVSKEDFLVTANDQFKLKLLNANSKACRRTALGPLFAGPISRMISIPGSDPKLRCLAYSTAEQVIGLIKLPIDGNPNNVMGIVAHAGEITGIAATYDGKWLLTTGGTDQSLYAWRVDPSAIPVASSDPFASLIEGGRDGPMWKQIEQYFWYAQIRASSEASTNDYKITGQIPLSQVPDVFRALGFFPTDREIADIMSEVRFSRFIDSGEQTEFVTFEELIKLYVNHKPVFAITKEALEGAFQALGANAAGSLPWEEIMLALQYRGEQISETEVARCLEDLMGTPNVKPPAHLTASDFARLILGFEDYNGGEEEAQ
eukprot:m51a1_g11742 hypothetical protein (841) ;mRNA; f:151348-154453